MPLVKTFAERFRRTLFKHYTVCTAKMDEPIDGKAPKRLRYTLSVMSECSLSGRSQGHVNNFYNVDLENFATASRLYTGDIHNSTVVGLFMTPIGQWQRPKCVTVECTCLLHIGPP